MSIDQALPIGSTAVDVGTVQTVDGRKLHAWLEVGKDFSTWIKDRIRQYEFQQDVDFVSFPQKGGKPQGGAPSLEYHLTLDTAKELAMVERSLQIHRDQLLVVVKDGANNQRGTWVHPQVAYPLAHVESVATAGDL